MAKIALGKISQPSFTGTMQVLLGKPLQIKVAWRVKKLVDLFNEELKKFGELRKEILERHCTRGEDGKPALDEAQNYTFDPEVMPKVASEMNELMSIEVECTPIKLSELVDGSGKDIDLTAQNLFDLGDVIQDA